MVTLIIMILGAASGRFFAAIPKKVNNMIQLICTLLLIFSMGAGLGRQEGFFQQLGELGIQSFLFFLLPTVLSAVIVYFLTRSLLRKHTENLESLNSEQEETAKTSSCDPMMFFAIGALLLGIGCGRIAIFYSALTTLSAYSEWVLYLLMFSAGISVGKQKGILSKLIQFNIKILIVPLGIIVGSLIGGVVCGLILKYPVHKAISISGGLGWYSLAGVTIGNAAGAAVGSVAFLSNLMREIASFILIPFAAKYLNSYTCIAIAGATSEDTTLPMIICYTDAEAAVFSVVNGVICSTFVPILFSICY